MSTIQLNPREMMYVASQIEDAQSLYGITDGFYGMDGADIAAEISNVQLSLTNKDYAEMDFDGNFLVKQEICDIVAICTNRDKYISFDKTKNGSSKIIRFYIKGDQVIKLTEAEDGYELTSCSYGDIKPGMTAFVEFGDEKPVEGGKIVLETDALAKIKGLSEFDNPENELKSIGCSEVNAKIIYEGLTGFANYYAMLVMDFTSAQTEVKSLMFIISDDGIITLAPVFDEDRELIEAHPVSKAVLSEQLNKILSEAVPDLVEEFV